MAALKSKAYTNNTIQWTSNCLQLSALFLGEAIFDYVHLVFISFSLLLLLFSYNFEGKICIYFIRYMNYCEVFHSGHSLILITSSVLQQNAHYMFAKYAFSYRISPTRFGVLRTNFREYFVCHVYAPKCQLFTSLLHKLYFKV